jgi:spore maturation protein CgeB
LSTLNENYTGPEATALLQNHPGRFHDSVLGLEYFKILSRSRINLNKHIDCAGIHAGNIRLFEATGMGACLVTDWKENMPEMFESDAEVITYRSPEECAEKVRYLLDNQDQLQHIASAGQRRTLRDHTYQRRE